MIRVGVIGYGYWGPNIVRNFFALPQSRVTMVADLRRDSARRVVVDVRDDDVRPFGSEAEGGRAADAVAGAGYQCGLTFESHGSAPFGRVRQLFRSSAVGTFAWRGLGRYGRQPGDRPMPMLTPVIYDDAMTTRLCVTSIGCP